MNCNEQKEYAADFPSPLKRAERETSAAAVGATSAAKDLTSAAAQLRTCIHKRLSRVWRWEIFTTAWAEAMEIS